MVSWFLRRCGQNLRGLAFLGLAVALLASVLLQYRVADSESWTDFLPQRGQLAAQQYDGIKYYLYVPNSLDAGKPATVLVTLAGFGGDAGDFAQGLTSYAEQYGWVLISPQLPYGDYKQIEAVKADDRKNFPWIHSLITSLTDSIPNLSNRVLLYGFSRGAQTAHRWAFSYPEHVVAAAAMSAGSYTLPKAIDPSRPGADLCFPLGVSDLSSYCNQPFDLEKVKKVHFWVGVGDADNLPGDVARAWDLYLGQNRLDRAEAFAKILESNHIPVEITTFPGEGHWETPESRSAAMAFLSHAQQAELSQTPGPDSDPANQAPAEAPVPVP